MDFRIADTFTDSLARLTGEEQKAVKTTAFDLQMNPANPGMSFHKLDKAKDKNFWSVRVSSDIRVIVHRTDSSLLLCFVDHHDKAYQWAERRKLEVHPKTGAAQLVVIREAVQESPTPSSKRVVPPTAVQPPLFASIAPEELLSYGVPLEWVEEVRQVDEDSLLSLADNLPAEAAEALLELATGGKPKAAQTAAPSADPFEHPDSLRRFRMMNDAEELARALEFPWEKWTIFLHPDQRSMVEANYSGPARVSGSAGTGKTIVALHRAAFLARTHQASRILLTTFSETLARALHAKIRRLISNEPKLGERLEVHALNAIGERLYEAHFGRPRLAGPDRIQAALREAMGDGAGGRFSLHFLVTEWTEVVDAWQLESWEAYRDVKRLGRKTRLSESQRMQLWSVFDAVRTKLANDGLLTHAGLFRKLEEPLSKRNQPPFDYVVVDECQDVGIPQLRFLAALAGVRQDGLFFTGDLGQRIFQQPFSWKALGVEVRGRSRTLHVNYRTSHQIRTQADKLLGPELADVDGNSESRMGTVSVFNGPAPILQTLATPEAEAQSVGDWLAELLQKGLQPHEMGIFVRSEAQLDRARAASKRGGIPFKILDDRVETTHGHLSISTMHLAKGLEFRAVAVMACDDEVIPLMERIEAVADDSDLEDVYNTERHLLYVACTRARDYLMVTSGSPESEFLGDLGGGDR
ncbi:MAG: DEAD/DEAH box helicase [Acidobacteria bacterium]|nr:DEAD/DEAH box helicase [Acidobacteriota bacterium]